MERFYTGKAWSVLYWALFAAAALCASLRLIALVTALPTSFLRDDFNHYYATAWLLKSGSIPYGISFTNLALGAPFQWTEYTPMATNPPVLAMLTVPLAIFGPLTAWLIWESLVVVSLSLSFGLVLRELQPRLSRRALLLVPLLILSSAAACRLVEHAQVQALILLAVVLGWALARRHHWAATAVLWGFAAAIKFYAWPMLLILLRKDFRTFGLGVLSFTVVSLLPAAFYGWDIYQGFTASAFPILRDAFYHLGHNMSVGRSVAQLFSVAGLLPEAYPLRHFIASTAVPYLLLACAAFFVVDKIRSTMHLDFLVSLVCAWAFLCSPTAWTNYTVALFFPALVMLAYSESSVLRLMLVAGWAALFVSPLPGSILMPIEADLYYGLLRVSFALSLLALTIGSWACCTQRRTSVSSEKLEPKSDPFLPARPQLAA